MISHLRSSAISDTKVRFQTDEHMITFHAKRQNCVFKSSDSSIYKHMKHVLEGFDKMVISCVCECVSFAPEHMINFQQNDEIMYLSRQTVAYVSI